MEEEKQLTLPIAGMSDKRPNVAIIRCRERDNHVEEFVNHYAMMSLSTEVVISDTQLQIEVHLMLDDEELDVLTCPQEKDVANGNATI